MNPPGVLAAVTIESELSPDPLTVDGLKVAVAPAGSPLILRLTGAVNPFTPFTVTP